MLLKTISRFFQKQESSQVFTLGLLLAIGVGLLDYHTGSRFGFYPFYFLPIFVVANYSGTKCAIAISVVCALIWLSADVLAKNLSFSYQIVLWNTSIRLFTFLILAFGLSVLRLNRTRQRELTDFIVHDLRSPLAVISESLNLLRETASEKLTADEKEFIDMGALASTRLATLVTSILDLSRIEAGKMPLDFSDVDLNEALTTSLKTVSVLAKKNGVHLSLKDNLADKTIRTDQGLLMRVLINLLSNAIKISPRGSTVEVSASSPQPGLAEISVRDEGPGIPKKIAKKLFNKFTQIEARGKGLQFGSGLGLNFCKSAVELLGGHIHLESEVGKGSRVVFSLPLN